MLCGEGLFTDPVSGCGCISKTEFFALYPDWATERDIKHADKLMWQTWEKENKIDDVIIFEEEENEIILGLLLPLVCV